jgi:hypothetical protein
MLVDTGSLGTFAGDFISSDKRCSFSRLYCTDSLACSSFSIRAASVNSAFTLGGACSHISLSDQIRKVFLDLDLLRPTFWLPEKLQNAAVRHHARNRRALVLTTTLMFWCFTSTLVGIKSLSCFRRSESLRPAVVLFIVAHCNVLSKQYESIVTQGYVQTMTYHAIDLPVLTHFEVSGYARWAVFERGFSCPFCCLFVARSRSLTVRESDPQHFG